MARREHRDSQGGFPLLYECICSMYMYDDGLIKSYGSIIIIIKALFAKFCKREKHIFVIVLKVWFLYVSS